MAKSRKAAAAKGINDVTRQTVTTKDLGPSAAPVLKGILKKSGNSKSDAPDNAGSATHRTSVMNENLGARRVIDPNFNALPASNPESRMTQANGRIVRSTPVRWGNFDEGRYGNLA